jgi:hypothetical protein
VSAALHLIAVGHDFVVDEGIVKSDEVGENGEQIEAVHFCQDLFRSTVMFTPPQSNSNANEI